MTNLDIWNNLILDHFFNINRSGKLVRLNVTKELIEDLGVKQGWKFNDFLSALKNGSCYIKKTNENLNICEYAYSLYDYSIDDERWHLAFKNDPRPPYVAYLGFFVYLTTLQNANNNSYHKTLWEHFPLIDTNNPPNFYPDFNKMVDLWDGLENWSKKENLGEFSITKLGKLEHISIPKSQAILTDKEKTELPHFFESANLNKNSKMDSNRWKQAIRDNPKSFMNRTLEALDHDRLSDYLITDLEDALKNWDGTIPNPAKQNLILQNSTQTSNVSKLVLFFDNFRGDLIPRIRFFSDSPECLEIVKYFNNYQTLCVTPKDGWSNCLQTIVNKNNVRFDASSISWTTPFELKTDNSNTPSELRFESRPIRVFVSANRLSLSGYFEVDKLPSSGACLIAFHNDKKNEINNWFNEAGLSPILKKNAKLAEGWKLLDLNKIPTDQNIRNNFPGESENPDVIFKFVGGLKYKKQGRVSNNKYYSNFPPCVELHGEYLKWVLTCNDKTLEVNSEGIAKLPENLGTGKFIIKIIKNNELKEKPIELCNVYHAGDPLRIHKHMDKFGFPGENTTGFSGGWLSDLTASNYEWSCKTQNNQIVSRNGIQWGISSEFLTPDLIQDASDCKNYPVQYFYDLCKLNSDAPIEDRNVSGERVSKFHEQNGLFPPEQGLPLSRLLPINNIYERSIHSTPSNRGHTHSFLLPDVKVFKENVTFLMQTNAEPEGCFLKLKSHPTNDQFPKCNGIYNVPAPFNLNIQQNQGTLRGTRTETYDTSYQLMIMPEESSWSVNKIEWAPNKWNPTPRWIYPECCNIKQLIITPWQINDLFKHLDVYNSLLNYGKNISCPNEITIPNDLETVLTEQNEFADIHKRVINSPPSIQKVLSIKGAAQSEILECPEYEDMPTSVKLAWILAWIDRRVAWEGRSILNKIKVEDQLALRKSILIAFKIDHPWANLFAKCLAISEYVLTILRKKGTGQKNKFWRNIRFFRRGKLMSDHLIIALSQRGVFSWATFRDILEEMFDDMFLFDSLIKPSHGLKILEGLGFISSNFNEGSGQLYVCPRTLVRVPSNPRHAILVGHRTADTQILLETICKSINGVTLDLQKNKLEFVPDRVMISVEDESVFLEIANQVEANYHPDPSSWRILQFAGTLDEYVNKLHWENRPPYNWERSDFNTDSINFVPVNPNNNQPLINNSVLIQLKNPDYGRHEFYLYRNNPSQQICKVDRDWGRFLSLFKANKNVLLFSNSNKLAVPKQALLPSIFAIGLSMCSGFPPSDVYLNNKSYFVYQNIPREFGELVATKLGQHLIFDNTI